MLRQGGGYRTLRAFQIAEAIYDGTARFCDRFIDRRSRTHDQMVQAARSGRQNIAEGSRAAKTSSQSELKLIGVARASLDELLLDYEDFLRQRRLALWDKEDPRALRVRQKRFEKMDRSDRSDRSDQSDQSDRSDRSDPKPQTSQSSPYQEFLEQADAETFANTQICLIHQANYLLDRLLSALEQRFLEQGGYREQLASARRNARWRGGNLSDQSDRSDRSDQSDQTLPPACPRCGTRMILRRTRAGAQAGTRFWGCPHYPDCRGARPCSP